MGTRATLIVLFVSALSLALLAFHTLRPAERGTTPAVEVHNPSTYPHPLTERADEPVATTSALVNDRTNERPRVPATLEHQGLPQAMALALQGVGMGQSPPRQALETERAFVSEAVDPLWSPRMEADINAEITQITGSNVLTLEVECKTTMCRVQMATRVRQGEPDVVGMNEVYRKLSDRLGIERRPVMFAINSGVATTLVYLPRPKTGGAGENVHPSALDAE